MPVIWFLDSALCLFVLWIVGLIQYATPNDFKLILSSPDSVVWLIVGMSFGATTIGLYRPDTFLKTSRMLAMLAIASMIVAPATIAFTVSTLRSVGHLYPRLVGIFEAAAVWMICVAIIHTLLGVALRNNLFVRRVMILQPSHLASHPERRIDERQRLLYRIQRTTVHPTELRIEQAHQQRIWALVTDFGACAPQEMTSLLALREAGVRIYCWSDFLEQQLRCLDLSSLNADLFAFTALHKGRIDQALRWISSMAITLLLVLLTLPLMALVAVLIPIESKGGPFYRQERIGLNGKAYRLWKFRSMRQDAEVAGPVWAQRSDPRVTTIGRFIRRVRIDELPQLFNVLRGDMCLVGPRPERPGFVETLNKEIPGFSARAQVKPGITGWAQVNYPYGASVEDARRKLSYDLYYIKHRSWLLDIEIILATIRVVLFQEGAR